MDPMPYTLRQLYIMFDAKTLADWDQTAMLTTHLINIPIHISNMFSKRRTKPVTWDHIHPFRQKERKTLTPAGLRSLKGLFDGSTKRKWKTK